MPITRSFQQDFPLARLIAWLDMQEGIEDRKVQRIVTGIKTILNTYIEHGPSSHVQSAFNHLAAREHQYGRAILRLRARTDSAGIKKVLGRSLSKLSSDETMALETLVEKGDFRGALGRLPEKTIMKLQHTLRPRLLAVLRNPLFDLWLTLLDDAQASRVRKCRLIECQRFFIAWTKKKEFCSGNCRNRYWTRPQRKAAGHKR